MTSVMAYAFGKRDAEAAYAILTALLRTASAKPCDTRILKSHSQTHGHVSRASVSLTPARAQFHIQIHSLVTRLSPDATSRTCPHSRHPTPHPVSTLQRLARPVQIPDTQLASRTAVRCERLLTGCVPGQVGHANTQRCVDPARTTRALACATLPPPMTMQ